MRNLLRGWRDSDPETATRTARDGSVTAGRLPRHRTLRGDRQRSRCG